MKKVSEHKNWVVWLLSVETAKGLPIYVAAKDQNNMIEGIDIPDLIADIDETER